ncbi:MAG: M15 family metallopeptidase [Alphaproteobacteria bacterium]|uniref:D-alanyl-D-alanine dipeptidase n=1 Tax=Candidatus Nitrobium versatile TaxID=2884831 RepID=A0A953M2Z3_9BACT|nr:M15 family metallopeptidase [Candidatus Nitrobium versatile]
MKRVPVSAFLVVLFLLCAPLLHGEEEKENTAVPSGNPGKALSAFEKQLREAGFADVQEIDPTLKVELKYASMENFMGINVYGDLTRGYLRREAAEKLATANRYLKRLHPRLSLLVVDGLRPRHVQRRMWEIVRGTPMQRYIANPHGGSLHNYGCAVDITIVDELGNRLDMGTPMDHFGILSQPRYENTFLKEGKLTAQHIANRRLLRKVMVAAGFHSIPIEWWHFEAFKKHIVRKRYSIIE